MDAVAVILSILLLSGESSQMWLVLNCF